MDVLIMGGTGYIGKIVPELLLVRSDNVTRVSRGRHVHMVVTSGTYKG